MRRSTWGEVRHTRPREVGAWRVILTAGVLAFWTLLILAVAK